MSEEEKKLRLDYRKIRKKWITVQSIILAVVLVITLCAAIVAELLNKTYYVNYSEKSSIDYGVQLKDNDFYEDSFLGKDYAYIASLIDNVHAKFNYELKMQSQDLVDFEYSYRVDAVVQIRNRSSGKVLFAPVYNEVAKKSYSISDTNVSINQAVLVDYAKYNDIADRFIDTYKLTGVESNLILQMHIDVTGTSEEFQNDKNSNSYIASVSIPLTTQTVEVKITSAIPSEEQKILSYTTEKTANVFRLIAVVFAVISALVALILFTFAYLSRNVDITYDIKVSKLVRNYKSFIQKIRNSFDVAGYQVLLVDTFEEMLEIRDTIQSPILMDENEDKTCTKFFIPTNTKLLYLYEIKVDDYDELYKPNDDGAYPTPPADAEPEGDVTDGQLDESTSFAQVAEAAPEADGDAEAIEAEPEADGDAEAIEAAPEADGDAEVADSEEDGDALIPPGVEITEEAAEDSDGTAAIAYIDETGRKIDITCNRSFMANLIQSGERVKTYYSALRNRILSYKGVKPRTSWRLESYNKGRVPLFKMKIRGKTICLYLALDPNEFDRARYFHEEATAKIFAAVPMLVRVRSDRGLKKALGLVDTVMERFGLSPNPKAVEIDYVPKFPYETTRALIERKLIKLNYPDAVVAERKPEVREHQATVEVVHDDVIEEVTIFDTESVDSEAISEMIETPTPSLEEIDFVDTEDEEFIETESHPGVDVIGVVWPDKPKRNKVYRYDPDGEKVSVGDIVLVPTRDVASSKEVIRKAAVAHENHKVDPDTLLFPLKKIVGVLRRKIQGAVETQAAKKKDKKK